MLAGLSAASMDPDERSTDVSMEELAELVDTAGGEVAGVVLQQRPTPDPRSFIGEGKVAELKELITNSECDLAVFDNELSPSQHRVLSEELGVKVLDRSGLILDIFAQRARTREGQLQVELAQYEYLLPRLTGMWTHLERQAGTSGKGPIGSKGPGETQLETDRRHIHRKIDKLREDLEEVRRVRGTQRERRRKNEVPVVAIVGYTNAGKSTLLNALTDAGIPARNRLFDTLDTTTRTLEISDTCTVLISDTVGFIRKLPHHLVEAFKSTLEQAATADILLNVCDASSGEARDHLEVTNTLLNELGAAGHPIIPVLNKWDAVEDPELAPRLPGAVRISALHGDGIPELLQAIEDNLPEKTFPVELLLPFSKTGLAAKLREEGAVTSEEYVPEGLRVSAQVDQRLYALVKEFEIQ